MVTTGYELSEEDTLTNEFCMTTPVTLELETVTTYSYVCVNDTFEGKEGSGDDWTVDLTRKVYAVGTIENGSVPTVYDETNSVLMSTMMSKMTKRSSEGDYLWNVGELSRDESEAWDNLDFYLSYPTCDDARCGASLVIDIETGRTPTWVSNDVAWASKSTLTIDDKSGSAVSDN